MTMFLSNNNTSQQTTPCMPNMIIAAHHYAFDAVKLLDGCIEKLQQTIDRDVHCQHIALYDLKRALLCTERLLHDHLLYVLEAEVVGLPGYGIRSNDIQTLAGTVAALQSVIQAKKRLKDVNNRLHHFRNPQESPQHKPQQMMYFPPRSATDTLLFRLIVALQLCVVRIDDAHLVLTGKRLGQSSHTPGIMAWTIMVTAGCLAGTGVVVISLGKDSRMRATRLLQPLLSGLIRPLRTEGMVSRKDYNNHTLTALKLGVAAIASRWVSNQWSFLWMTDKIVKSTTAIEEWQQQWQSVLATHEGKVKETTGSQSPKQPTELLDAKSRRLIEFAMKESTKSSFLQSQGEMRFLMLKRAMDVFYASVGTAISSVEEPNSSTWQVPLITAAAASFYSLTGANKKALNVVNSSSRDLLQHAWGMVSLPAIKNLVLQASRLLKGAAVADRFEIAGVPCFVLSTAPAPELAAALKRQPLTKARPSRPSEAFLSKLSTIDESAEASPHKPCASNQRKFAGSGSRYRQRDVILHLTGGGFFAHTIASDLPYLLDWSAATGAVVICPEYALLPEHIFPFALNQIVNVYSALRDGDAASELGFETNRIIVTGESAGGNLAAALCIKLGMEYLEKKETEVQHVTEDEAACHVVEDDSHNTPTRASTRMPDAMMLSCAALNLSLELSHSRVLGLEDPVLPSGLISAISDAYLPPHKGLSKQDPLASPFYASDNVLELFPPTLLFAGSKDPLLDDSVDFNERLRCLGVKSELRAANNVPHAYWGLGTAGFPEAQQVQRECEEWLAHQFGLQP